MTTRPSAIARYTVLEAWRTRLLPSAVIAFLLVLGASYFVREVALIQDARMQTALYASIARLAAVFIVALHVMASLGREFDDKGLDAVLALDIPRWQYIAGKFAGYALLAVAVAAVAALPLFGLANPARVLAWFTSLALESCIIAALAMFCVVTFSHLAPAMAFVAGFYVLCRAMTGLRLLAQHPIAGGETFMHEIMTGGLEAISLLLPPLDVWTRTAWLVDRAPQVSELGYVAVETAMYAALLLSATLVDFYRKNV